MNLSYGYGKVFTVPFQKLSESGNVQGGMCQLPLPQFPTGTMRGRFHPLDKQLYICGLFAWGSSQQAKEGGLYRIRYTGKGATMPTVIRATPNQLQVTFSDALEPQAATELSRYKYQAWSLKRTKDYGSKHYDEYELKIESAQLSDDGHQLILTMPGLKPTWCYELKCDLKTNSGRPVERIIHGTIHNLP